MKKFVLFCVLVAVFLTGCRGQHAVIKVNGKMVDDGLLSYYMLMAFSNLRGVPDFSSRYSNDEWAQAQKNQGVLMPLLREKAVELAIRDAVLYEKATAYGIVDDDEFMKSVTNQLESFKAKDSEGNFVKTLDGLGITESAFEQIVSMNLALPQLEQKLSSDRQNFEGLQTNKNPTRVSAKHILILVKPQEDSSDRAEEKIRSIYARLKNGEDFDLLMKQYSEDPGLSKCPAGYVFSRGDMVKEFEDATFALNIGEFSEPFKSAHGYHIVERTALAELEDKFVEEAQVTTAKLKYAKLPLVDNAETKQN